MIFLFGSFDLEITNQNVFNMSKEVWILFDLTYTTPIKAFVVLCVKTKTIVHQSKLFSSSRKKMLLKLPNKE